MFRIKICGITSVEDARAAVDAGADALGLNFYEKSPRYVATEQARAIVAALDDLPLCVGVFVNSSREEIERIRREAGLRGVQLHGDEPAEFLVGLGACPIIRARRMDERGAKALAEDVVACQAAGRLPDAILVDAAAPGHYGGTGKTIAWSELFDSERWLAGRPLILAGGLNPHNVAEAIRVVRPNGVDVASGVESSPGVKDPEKMRLFVSAAKAAFSGFPR
ncbi:MAG: phosphoribosylanthranilate isomerase [Planctomycetales bacterium]|nr:phosphoribosylanthranilate isomerase [Planctomycetales bacterium]